MLNLLIFSPNLSVLSPVKLATTVLWAAGTNIEMLNGSLCCLGQLCFPSVPMIVTYYAQGDSVKSLVSFPFQSEVLKLIVPLPFVDLK